MKRFVELLERAFRHAVVYPILRIAFRNPESDKRIDLRTIKRVLIFRYDRIGDMIITTPIFRALKHHNPDLRLAVLASAGNAELVRANPNVDDVHILPRSWYKLLMLVVRLRRQRYDVVLNFVFNRTTGPAILANLIAPQGHKVGQGPEQYSFYFNRLLKLPRFEQHMIRSLACYIEEVFGIRLAGDDLAFELVISDEAAHAVDEFLEQNLLCRRSSPKQNRSPYVIFNLSAKDKERRISVHQAAVLANHLSLERDFRTVLLCAPEDEEMKQALASDDSFRGCALFQTSERDPLTQIASIVGGASFVITPDTSIVHFASAMHTPILGIYTALQGMQEWLPHNVDHDLVTAPSGKPASAIDPDEIVRATDRFIASVLVRPRRVEERPK